MFIQDFSTRFTSRSAQVKLPRSKLVLDPRANDPHDVVFDCHYHDDGMTVTLTIVDGVEQLSDGIMCSFSMRVYDPVHETIPDFNSTIYRYSGLYRERAPSDTTIAIIDPSVKTIQWRAFYNCGKMKKCIMHGEVKTIKQNTFRHCVSLETLFLPSSIRDIGFHAFYGCTNIRILSVPINIDISQIDTDIIYSCHTFVRITHIPEYKFDTYWRTINNPQVNQAIIDFYRNMHPLHRACLDVNVSTQTIHDCIVTHGPQAASIIDHDGMTPLHILSLNPHATVGCIEECLDANTSAALLGDSRGNTPLDYLMEENNLDGHTWIVTALCMHRQSMMG